MRRLKNEALFTSSFAKTPLRLSYFKKTPTPSPFIWRDLTIRGIEVASYLTQMTITALFKRTRRGRDIAIRFLEEYKRPDE